ncbi:SDR family oxidoreductase [Paracoccus aestuariivivens]|uniref:SDR family oxidoreductase n=1 Tax=Paracoccus aestuariivivens TaxID=1820333 RepID=A0A6L6JJH0_9RHOB|nr:SDR family oxidoreductase [Paracoccus aestuariivivens]MTH80294.1 SDR family oxidoreductase [Paracoccus aestuariivivens]
MLEKMKTARAEIMDEIAAAQPIWQLRQFEELATAVLWLWSPAASFVVGVGLPVDGGFSAHLTVATLRLEAAWHIFWRAVSPSIAMISPNNRDSFRRARHGASRFSASG